MNRVHLDPVHWTLLKDSGRITVYKSWPPQHSPVVVKTYALGSWLARLAFLRRQRRLRAFQSQMAGHLNMPALLGSGLLEGKSRGYLCYKFIAGEDFRRLPWSATGHSVDLMEQAASLLARLHRGGWAHGDFKFGNLFYSASDARVYLLDTESLRAASASRKARDLARFLLNGVELNVPAHCLSAFWNSYQRRGGGNVPKSLIRRWLVELQRRHARKYDRSADLNQLDFL